MRCLISASAGAAPFAGLGEHHDALGSARRVLAAEYRHAAAAHAGNVADRFLQLVRADVATAADDDVLFAAGDVEHAVGEIGAIAGVHPLAVEQALGRLGVAVVAAGRRGAAELERAFGAVGQLDAGGVDHAQLVVRDRLAAAHHLERCRIAFARERGVAAARERLAVEQIHLPRIARRREREADRAFGQAVDRRHGVAVEAPFPEFLAEADHGLRAHRLGAVEREAPARQIEALELVLGNAAQAQLVGEIRPAGNRAAMAVDGAQPRARPREEGERRHQHHRKREIHGGEAAADQAHVVVEREPAHEHVGGSGARRFPHGAHVGEQVGVRQHHAFGLSGAAGGVLQEPGLACRCLHRGESGFF